MDQLLLSTGSFDEQVCSLPVLMTFIGKKEQWRISRRVGRGPRRGGGGMDSGGSSVSNILYVKTKESGPLRGGVRRARSPLDPPMKKLP